MNNVTRYSVLQRKLHWLVVIIVGLQFLLQTQMHEAMESLAHSRGLSFSGFLVTTMHTWGGALAGGLMVYRLWLRWLRPVPVGAGQLSGPVKVASMCLHWGFYAILLVMALSGMLSYYFDITSAARVHEIGKWILGAMIVLHTLAALLHHFWKKDDVMRQMLGTARHTDTMTD